MEQFEQVFEDFERLEDSRNRATGGTGLGLSLAREIIHSQGGRILLENRAPGGAASLCSPAPDTVRHLTGRFRRRGAID